MPSHVQCHTPPDMILVTCTGGASCEPVACNKSMPASIVAEIRLPPVASAATRGLGQGAISFLHPGYNEPINVLFRMPRVDHVPSVGGELRYGVHHRTALAACQIVANNAFDGFLALDRSGTQAVNTSVPLDGILTVNKYYFIISSSPIGKSTSCLCAPLPSTDGFAPI